MRVSTGTPPSCASAATRVGRRCWVAPFCRGEAPSTVRSPAVKASRLRRQTARGPDRESQGSRRGVDRLDCPRQSPARLLLRPAVDRPNRP